MVGHEGVNPLQTLVLVVVVPTHSVPTNREGEEDVLDSTALEALSVVHTMVMEVDFFGTLLGNVILIECIPIKALLVGQFGEIVQELTLH